MAGEAPADCAGAEEIARVPIKTWVVDLSGRSGKRARRIGLRHIGARLCLWSALLVTLAVALPVRAGSDKDLTVDQLKDRVANASVGDRPKLCVEIAQRQLGEADKLYAASEIEKAQAPLTDVIAFS